MNWRDHIHSDPRVLGGKPVIMGTRISVELILEYFEEGATIEDVLVAYPHLTDEQIRAAVTFARELLIDDATDARRFAA